MTDKRVKTNVFVFIYEFLPPANAACMVMFAVAPQTLCFCLFVNNF